jgi:hypothetical protein
LTTAVWPAFLDQSLDLDGRVEWHNGHERLAGTHDLADGRDRKLLHSAADRGGQSRTLVLGRRFDKLPFEVIGLPFDVGQFLCLIGDELGRRRFKLPLKSDQGGLVFNELAFLSGLDGDLRLILLQALDHLGPRGGLGLIEALAHIDMLLVDSDEPFAGHDAGFEPIASGNALGLLGKKACAVRGKLGEIGAQDAIFPGGHVPAGPGRINDLQRFTLAQAGSRNGGAAAGAFSQRRLQIALLLLPLGARLARVELNEKVSGLEAASSGSPSRMAGSSGCTTLERPLG